MSNPRPYQLVGSQAMRILLLLRLLPLLGASPSDCPSESSEVSEASLLQLGSGLGVGCAPVPQVTCDKLNGEKPQAHSKQQMRMLKDLDPAVPLTPWNCSLCQNLEGAATVYGVERWDGLGQRAASLINFMALAAHLKLNFGGLLPNPSELEHGVYIPDCMTPLFGTSYKGLRRLAAQPHFDVCLFGRDAIRDATRRAEEAESSKGRWRQGQSLLIEECGNGREFVDYLTPDFQQRLREASHIKSSKAVFFSGKHARVAHVAVHVRRGDLTARDHWAHRNVEDDVYLSLVEATRAILRDLHCEVEVHVFSSTEGGAFSSADFENYRKRKMHVHLDGKELDDWAHMAHADILIQAPSAFSWVPGVLSSKCVVAFDSYPKPLPEWIQHSHGSIDRANRQRLRECISKRVLSSTV